MEIYIKTLLVLVIICAVNVPELHCRPALRKYDGELETVLKRILVKLQDQVHAKETRSRNIEVAREIEDDNDDEETDGDLGDLREDGQGSQWADQEEIGQSSQGADQDETGQSSQGGDQDEIGQNSQGDDQGAAEQGGSQDEMGPGSPVEDEEVPPEGDMEEPAESNAEETDDGEAGVGDDEFGGEESEGNEEEELSYGGTGEDDEATGMDGEEPVFGEDEFGADLPDDVYELIEKLYGLLENFVYVEENVVSESANPMEMFIQRTEAAIRALQRFEHVQVAVEDVMTGLVNELISQLYPVSLKVL